MSNHCSQCGQKLVAVAKMATRLRKVNSDLHAIGLVYWETMSESLAAIEYALQGQNFETPVDRQILNYRLHVEVGDGKWLSATWHRMESGRYKVVAYVIN